MVWIDPTNVTNIPQYMTWVNGVTGGMLGNLMLLAIFFVSFLVLKTNWETSKCFSAATTITVLSAIFLYILGMIEPGILALCIILFIVGFVAIFRSDKN